MKAAVDLLHRELGETLDNIIETGQELPMVGPVIKQTAGVIKFWWGAEQVQAAVSRIHQHRDGRVTSEIKFTNTAPGFPTNLHQAQINLVATRSKKELAKHLEGVRNDVSWESLIEGMAWEILDRTRQGEPVIVISTDDEVEPPSYLIEPMIPEDEPTVLFGLGGSGKSTMALICAMAIQLPWTPNPLGLGVKERKGVMYLDWETNHKRITYRMKSLQKGMGLPYFYIHYRRCSMPLADDTEAIQRAIMDNNIGFVVIDSVGAACGGDLNAAEPAISMFRALRELKVTSLLVAHTSKNSGDKEKSIYGSAYFNFYARSVWEMKKVQEAGESRLNVGLYHKKVNDDGVAVPLGFEIEHNKREGWSRIRNVNMNNVAEFAENMPIKSQARNALLKHGRMTLKELSVATGIKKDSLYSKLYDMQKEGETQCDNGQWWIVRKE